MKRLIFLLTMMISFISICISQEFHYGIYAGANLNTMKIGTDLYIGDVDNADKLMTIGFRGGVFAEYSFNKHIGVQTDLAYSQYGYRVINELVTEVGNESYIFGQKEERIVNDISFALMFKWYLFNQHLAVDLGVQPSLTCSVKDVNEQTFSRDSLNVNISRQIISDTTFLMKRKEQYNAFNMSVVGGMTYYINKNVFVSARYMFGLTDIFVKEVGRFDEANNIIIDRRKQLSRNRVLQFGLGWRF